MKCPFCGKEMEKGCMTAGGHWVYWASDEETGLSDPVTICQVSFNPKKGVRAYLCQACRKVVAYF